MIRALIADDEPPARRKLRELLAREADFAVVAEAADGVAAVAAIREARPDVVFLDIQMPRLDGFGVIAEVGVEAMPLVVFVTAFDEHALRAFEVNALDYLLKPFAPSRLARLLARLRRQLAPPETQPAGGRTAGGVGEMGANGAKGAQGANGARGAIGARDAADAAGGTGTTAAGTEDAAGAPAMAEMAGMPPPGDLAARIERLLAMVRPAAGYVRQLLIERGEGRQALLAVDEIDLIRAVGNHLEIVAGATRGRRRGTLREIEERLDPARFLRLNRSEIVRLDAIRELQPWFHGDARVVLRDGSVLTWSRRYRARSDGIF